MACHTLNKLKTVAKQAKVNKDIVIKKINRHTRLGGDCRDAGGRVPKVGALSDAWSSYRSMKLNKHHNKTKLIELMVISGCVITRPDPVEAKRLRLNV